MSNEGRSDFKFSLESVCGGARAGRLTLRSGIQLLTPIFMPVGTQASVKSLAADDVSELSYNMMLVNTYHLMLRPGLDVIRHSGGIHSFMKWPGGVLSDSGGFQVFSLSTLRKFLEDGVEFRSHIDGRCLFLGFKDAIDFQVGIGVDIAMVLDECLAVPHSRLEARRSMDRTLSWAHKSRLYYQTLPLGRTSLFAIAQGGMYADLRQKCSQLLSKLDFDGYAIGGLSVGETESEMYDMLQESIIHLPSLKPRYLMGVGKPQNILHAIAQGVDMFDCVLPTRNARNGYLFTFSGSVHIKKKEHAFNLNPLEEECPCYTCQNFSRSYLHHLFRSRELLSYRLNTIHNLAFFKSLLEKARNAIISGNFNAYFDEVCSVY